MLISIDQNIFLEVYQERHKQVMCPQLNTVEQNILFSDRQEIIGYAWF